MKIFIQSLLMIMSLFLTQTYAASFDCNYAKTSTEHAICESLAVNDSDVKMATTQKRNESGHHQGATDVFRHKKRRLPFILLNFLNHTIILGFM